MFLMPISNRQFLVERDRLFDELSREELVQIIEVYAKAWQAMDGAYFLSLEREYDMEIAIEMDKNAWRIFSPIEARRIMREFNIPEGGGLDSLAEALKYRVYAALNKQNIKRKDDSTLIFTMETCRVQLARDRKGLPEFPCKQVGVIEYEEFAKTIDPKIKTEVVFCPPDEHPDEAYCQWKFTMEK